MKLASSIAVLVLIVSCTSSYPLKSVDYNDLFTDGNSKIWVIDKQWVNNVNIASHNNWAKDAMIFHENGTVDCISLKAMGHKEPVKAVYYLDSDKRKISFEFKKERWEFRLPSLQEKRIVMTPMKGSDAQFKLELIPLPEL